MSTVDDLVVGACNASAVAAALAVVDGALARDQAVYLYGGSGLGKTHLLRAIAAEVGVSPSTVEEMTRRITAALRDVRIATLRADVASRRFLLLDDVQTLAGRPATQNELAASIALVLQKEVRS